MAGKSDEEIKKQKDLHDERVKKHETRERKEEYDGLTLKEMRRKHSIPLSVGGVELLDAYRADKVGTVRKEESAEEIAHQRKVLDQAKMELEWDRKERDSRKDLEGEEAEKRKLTAQRLFLNLDPLPDAWKLVDYCMNSGIHTEILTAAGTVNRTLVIQDKIAWIRRHIHPHWIVVPTFKGSQKAAFAHEKAVLIDDRPKNIYDWIEAGGIGILHKTADETIEQLN